MQSRAHDVEHLVSDSVLTIGRTWPSASANLSMSMPPVWATAGAGAGAGSTRACLAER